MTDKAKGELKPCPFCGREPKAFHGQDGNGDAVYYIACDYCNAAPCVSDCSVPYAQQTWNTRADSEAVEALERIVRGVEHCGWTKPAPAYEIAKQALAKIKALQNGEKGKT